MTSEPRELEEFLRELTRHQRRLRGLVRCLLFDSRDVEDVWQDVNVTLLRKAGEFQPGTDFWAWACSVARYQVLTHCRRLGRDRLVFDEGLLRLIAEEVEQRGPVSDRRHEALQRCLEKLPGPQRQLLDRPGIRDPLAAVERRRRSTAVGRCLGRYVAGPLER
jgi:RNA polymerase sigma-70 factor (ECF subfamily)